MVTFYLKPSIVKSTLIFFAALIFLSGCETEVCYPNLECFSQAYPWVSLARPFPPPANPKDINISFIFYSREQTVGHWFTVYPNITFNWTGFSPRKRIVTIAHGYNNSALLPWVHEMKDAYLKKMDANIFLVDWAKGASTTNYFQAASNSKEVGDILGRFLCDLIEEKGANYSDFHLIGHSLGAHLSAYAANRMNNASSNNEKVYRITGLDAAQPGFQNMDPKVRLSRDDAQFVEAIHTDATIPGFGYIGDFGDVDFYINKGHSQPNCNVLNTIKNLTSINQLANVSEEVRKGIFCSHRRAFEVFISSINPDVKCKFVGYRLKSMVPIISNQFSCGINGSDCVTMGLDQPNYNQSGAYQVMTSGKPPYCCYNYSPVTGCSDKPGGGVGV